MNTPKISELTRDEKSLLLYAETVMVDLGGIYEPRRMNDEDRAIMKRWKESGFLDHGRVSSEHLTSRRAVWIRLSPEAVALAQELRRERIERAWGNRNWITTAEKAAL